MSSNDEISIMLYLRTILKGEIALKSALKREMSAGQLFERTAGSTPASLSCVHGYLSNMAPGTVKKVYLNVIHSLQLKASTK